MPSRYRRRANSCDKGPCPTLHFDMPSGVKVQGYVTTAPELPQIPAGEDVVFIPADAWARLLADVPAAMLLKALVAPWRFRRTSQPSPAVGAR